MFQDFSVMRFHVFDPQLLTAHVIHLVCPNIIYRIHGWTIEIACLMNGGTNALMNACGILRQFINDPHIDALVQHLRGHVTHHRFDIQIIPQSPTTFGVEHLPPTVGTVA